MLGRQRRPEPDEIGVVLGPRASFNGDLTCDTSIRLDGVVEGGTITTPANVVVTPNAKVMADIVAHAVSVSGAVKGSITAERVELLDGGHIWGTVKATSFLLDEGGFLRGELIMQGEAPEEPFVIPPPSKLIPVEEGMEAEVAGEAADSMPELGLDVPAAAEESAEAEEMAELVLGVPTEAEVDVPTDADEVAAMLADESDDWLEGKGADAGD